MSTVISSFLIPRMSPKRIAVISVAKERDRDTMMTPRESMRTKVMPIAVSWERRARRDRTATRTPMAVALSAAPASVGSPMSALIATPGSIPWPIASPRNPMPRMTTQVPATEQTSAARTPPARALVKNPRESGSKR